MDITPSIGFSDFFLTHSLREMGNSYTTLPPLSLLNLLQNNWHKRTPGTGEVGIDRKVLVPIPVEVSGFFCPPRVKLTIGMPLHAHVVARQDGEDPYIETFITPEDAAKYGFIETPAKKVEIVCYSADALLENNGKRTTTCQWEIVTLLCSDGGGEYMPPLTMARNQLEMAGGTKPERPYTSDEWARAVWANANRGVKVRPMPKKAN
jgi:hypothetical protein